MKSFQTSGPDYPLAYVNGYKPPQNLSDPTLRLSEVEECDIAAENTRRRYETDVANVRSMDTIYRQGGLGKVTPFPAVAPDTFAEDPSLAMIDTVNTKYNPDYNEKASLDHNCDDCHCGHESHNHSNSGNNPHHNGGGNNKPRDKHHNGSGMDTLKSKLLGLYDTFKEEARGMSMNILFILIVLLVIIIVLR